MGELARRSRLSKQTITTLVRLVERDGLVTRDHDPEDARRAFRVCLTERSEALRPVVEASLAELAVRAIARLTPAGVRRLKRSLKGVMEL